MVFRVEKRKFDPGDRVQLGSGEAGEIVERVERNGIPGYRVKVTDGPRKGETVGANPGGMLKLGQKCTRVRVRVGAREFDCRVAATVREQRLGLQDTPTLSPEEGLLFTFDSPRAATFHMGEVAYPIDIMFIHAGRVAKVVANAQPGSKERWSHSCCDAVLEIAAQAEPFSVGTKVAAPAMNPEDRYEISFPNEVTDAAPQPSDRWEERALPPVADPNSDQMDNKHWKQDFGYDPLDDPDHNAPVTRPSARKAQTINDPADFVVAFIKTMASRLDWTKDELNPLIDYAMVGPDEIMQWLDEHDLSGSEKTDMYAVATSSEGLNTIGDGLVVAGMADMSHLVTNPEGDQVLILWNIREDNNEK